MIVNLTVSSFINTSLREIGVCNTKHLQLKEHLEKLVRPVNYTGMSEIKGVVQDIVNLLSQIPDIEGVMLSPTMNGTCVMGPYLFKKLKQKRIKVFFKFSDDKNELILIPAPL